MNAYPGGTLAGALRIDIKTYYVGLYISSSLVILVVVLANIDYFSRQPQPEK
jgi:hypothetical protein